MGANALDGRLGSTRSALGKAPKILNKDPKLLPF
jgi:hypothetical protein